MTTAFKRPFSLDLPQNAKVSSKDLRPEVPKMKAFSKTQKFYPGLPLNWSPTPYQELKKSLYTSRIDPKEPISVLIHYTKIMLETDDEKV